MRLLRSRFRGAKREGQWLRLEFEGSLGEVKGLLCVGLGQSDPVVFDADRVGRRKLGMGACIVGIDRDSLAKVFFGGEVVLVGKQAQCATGLHDVFQRLRIVGISLRKPLDVARVQLQRHRFNQRAWNRVAEGNQPGAGSFVAVCPEDCAVGAVNKLDR